MRIINEVSLGGSLSPWYGTITATVRGETMNCISAVQLLPNHPEYKVEFYPSHQFYIKYREDTDLEFFTRDGDSTICKAEVSHIEIETRH